MKHVYSAALWVATFLGVHAQKHTSALDTGSFELDEVRVSETRTASPSAPTRQTATVLQARKIQFLNASSTADLLIQSGAAYVQKSQGGGGSPILRGFEANKVLIVVDGVRMNNAIFRGGHLQNVLRIDPNALERLEVSYGPTSVLYGSDALGGTMHFVTKGPRLGQPNQATALTRLGDATGEFVLHADVQYGGKKWAAFTSLTRSDYGNIRQGNRRLHGYSDFGLYPSYGIWTGSRDSLVSNPNPNVQLGTAYTQFDVIQKVLWKPNARAAHLLNLQYSVTGDVPRFDRLSERNAAGIPKNAEWYYGPEARGLASYQGTFDVSSRWADRLVVQSAYQRFEESRNSRKWNSPKLKSQSEQVDVVSTTVDLVKTAGWFHWNYGVEAYHQQVGSSAVYTFLDGTPSAPAETRYPGGGSTQQNAAAYVQQRIFSKDVRWSAAAGLRANVNRLVAVFDPLAVFSVPFDTAQQSNRALSWNVAIARELGVQKQARVVATVSRGFRTPNVDDLGRLFESGGGILIVPNNQLRPEQALQVELKAEGRIPAWGGALWEAGWYRTQLTQSIGLAKATWGGSDSVFWNDDWQQVYSTQNLDQGKIQGLFARIQFPVDPQLHWWVSSQANWTQGRLLQQSGTNIPLDHIPPAYGMTSLTYTKRGWKVELWSQYSGAKPLELYRLGAEDNELYATPEGMPGWTTANLRASYRPNKSWELQGAVDNILDVNYRYFASGVSAPGRTFRTTVRVFI